MVEKEINFSILISNKTTELHSMTHSMVARTNGYIGTNTGNFSNKLYNHIAGNSDDNDDDDDDPPPPNQVITEANAVDVSGYIVLSNFSDTKYMDWEENDKGKKIRLNEKVNSDTDTLYDYEEVDWSNLTKNSDGSYSCRTFDDWVKLVNPQMNVYWDKKAKNAKILSVFSNPWKGDSDGDLYLDCEETKAGTDPLKYTSYYWIPQGDKEAVYIGVHEVMGMKQHHTSIVVMATPFSDLYSDNKFRTELDVNTMKKDTLTFHEFDTITQYEYTGLKIATFGAGPKGSQWDTIIGKSTLLAAMNRDEDRDMTNKVEMIFLSSSTAQELYNDFVEKSDYFTDNYNIGYPALGLIGDYNSNSYTHGMIIAVGINYPFLYKPSFSVPLWNKPIPMSYFIEVGI